MEEKSRRCSPSLSLCFFLSASFSLLLSLCFFIYASLVISQVCLYRGNACIAICVSVNDVHVHQVVQPSGPVELEQLRLELKPITDQLEEVAGAAVCALERVAKVNTGTLGRLRVLGCVQQIHIYSGAPCFLPSSQPSLHIHSASHCACSLAHSHALAADNLATSPGLSRDQMRLMAMAMRKGPGQRLT